MKLLAKKIINQLISVPELKYLEDEVQNGSAHLQSGGTGIIKNYYYSSSKWKIMFFLLNIKFIICRPVLNNVEILNTLNLYIINMLFLSEDCKTLLQKLFRRGRNQLFQSFLEERYHLVPSQVI